MYKSLLGIITAISVHTLHALLDIEVDDAPIIGQPIIRGRQVSTGPRGIRSSAGAQGNGGRRRPTGATGITGITGSASIHGATGAIGSSNQSVLLYRLDGAARLTITANSIIPYGLDNGIAATTVITMPITGQFTVTQRSYYLIQVMVNTANNAASSLQIRVSGSGQGESTLATINGSTYLQSLRFVDVEQIIGVYVQSLALTLVQSALNVASSISIQQINIL